MEPVDDVIEALQAAEAFLVVVLARRVGALTALQREFLDSALARVRRSAELLATKAVDSEEPPGQAANDEHRDLT